MNNYDYPLGSDNADAPWNEVSVTAEGTITVSVTIPVDDECNTTPGSSSEDEPIDYFAEEAFKSPSDLVKMLKNGQVDAVINYLDGLDAEITEKDINLK